MKKIIRKLIILLMGCMLTGCHHPTQEFLLSAEKDAAQTEQLSTPSPGLFLADQDFKTEEASAEGEASQSLDTPAEAGGSDDGSSDKEEALIYVDVCGAVLSPGVYQLPANSRAFEAIAMAGGLRADASGISVNQAQPLNDGQQLYIPTLQEAQEMQSPGVNVPAASSLEPAQTSEETEMVNINTADKQTLMTLNGIGETRAEAILSYRKEHGAFRTVEDLLQVSGIKEGTLAKIRNRIVAG